MPKRAVAYERDRELEMDLVSDEEMARRMRLVEILRERMAIPPTELDLQLWEEFKEELEKERRPFRS